MMYKKFIITTFQENRLFFYWITVLLTIGLVPFFLYDKINFFLLIKQWHHPTVDHIAPYLTHIGNGVTYVCVVMLAMLWGVNWRSIGIMAGSFGCMAVLVQCIKWGLHMPRPTLLISQDLLHTVQGIALEKGLSFPSGHAATIFALVTVIQLLSKHKHGLYSFILLLLAIAVAYSRIYLCQHFYADVYVGAVIGMCATCMTYCYPIDGLYGLVRSLRCIYNEGKSNPTYDSVIESKKKRVWAPFNLFRNSLKLKDKN